MAFSFNEKKIVSGSNDKTIRIWDVESGKQVQRFEIDHAVHSVAFSSDRKKIVSGSR